MEQLEQLNPSSCALVVVDLQRAYFRNGELKKDEQRLRDETNRLITVMHRAHRPVIFIRTAHAKTPETWTINMRDDSDAYLVEGTDDVLFIPGLLVEPHDAVLTKLRDSAFYLTLLEQTLRELKIETIIIAGVSTQTCVGQTAADAYARNIHVLLATDAIGTHNHLFHESTLAVLTTEYRQLAVSNEEIEWWLKNAGATI